MGDLFYGRRVVVCTQQDLCSAQKEGTEVVSVNEVG